MKEKIFLKCIRDMESFTKDKCYLVLDKSETCYDVIDDEGLNDYITHKFIKGNFEIIKK